jgi:hypothetical protein
MSLFKGSILRGSSPINPDTIEVTDDSVIYKKRRIYLIGYDKVIIPFSKISSFEINTDIIGTIITIHSFGLGTIIGHKFSLKDSNKIKQLIEDKI